MSSEIDCRVLIHGGAFVFLLDGERATQYEQSLTRIIQQICDFVTSSLPHLSLKAIDIVEFAVKLLESDSLFNAGKGSVFSSSGNHVLEASIMDGKSREYGAASLIENVEHPISLARVVMEKTAHNYIAGRESTEQLAKVHGLDIVDDNSFFSTSRRLEQYHASLQAQEIVQENISALKTIDESASAILSNAKKGTVGCVVYLNGDVAAGTSTGGMTNKHPGRIGDSPLIGCGTYAENKCCAVSFTGTGEEIMKHVGSYDIAARMKYGGRDIHTAVHETLFTYMPVDTAGVVAVDGNGNTSLQWNTKGMLRGSLFISSSTESGQTLLWTKNGSIGVYDNELSVNFS